MSLAPIAQDERYHAFADTRAFLGVPNFFDVTSNVLFQLVGMWGLRLCSRRDLGALGVAWWCFFAGVALVGLGSAYYHWSPDSGTLLWDRLPMTVGFMGLWAALLGEFADPRLGRWMLPPALLLGAVSVLYWHWTNDLRFYAWVQFMPLLMVLLLFLLFKSPYSHQWLILVALGWYALAKGAELLDAPVFAATHEWVSGHTLKHCFAAAGCFSLLLMLTRRQPRDR